MVKVERHSGSPRARRAALIAERVLLLAGLGLIGIVAAAYIHRAVMVRSSIRDFEEARRQPASRQSFPGTDSAPKQISPSAASAVDRRASSPASDPPAPVRASRQNSNVPLALLRIPKIHLTVPVLAGTDEITLNRGVGQIAGMAAPGEKGNVGIAGHRDSFFRNLKEISRGDEIELDTPSSSATYIVSQVLVTGADDNSALQPSDEQILTLVTCYPFHFIGPAPRRFVVQAHLKP
jgi:sortase A